MIGETGANALTANPNCPLCKTTITEIKALIERANQSGMRKSKEVKELLEMLSALNRQREPSQLNNHL